MTMTYAILLSTAPEAVAPERFEHPVIAACFGQRVKQESGLEYEVMHWTEDGWRNAWGESPVEVFRKRWTS